MISIFSMRYIDITNQFHGYIVSILAYTYFNKSVFIDIFRCCANHTAVN